MADIWAELGIAPTADRALVRRAYAARLKATPPDGDPQAFTRLRQAYERALQTAGATPARPPRPSSGPAPEQAVPPVAASPAVAPPATPPPAVPPGAPLGAALAAALRRQDVVAAADWLLAARPGLSLADDMRLTDQLGWAMAQDRTLPAAAVRTAAERLGWRQDAVAAAWAETLRARLDAEQWLAALRTDAASSKRFLGAARSLSARILLGRGPMRLLRTMGNDRTLRQRYGEYLLHAGVVGDRFDRDRIAAVGQVLTARPDKPRSVMLPLFGILILAWACGVVAGTIDPQMQDGTTGMVAAGLFLALRVKGWLRRLRAARLRAAEGRLPRAVRIAFWLSLSLTAAVLAAMAGVGLAVTVVLDAPGAPASLLVTRLEDVGVPLVLLNASCLALTHGLMRRGWYGPAVLVAPMPMVFLLLGLLSFVGPAP